MSECPNCHNSIGDSPLVFCIKCGGVIDNKMYKSTDICHQYSQQLQDFITQIRQNKIYDFKKTTLPQLESLFINAKQIQNSLQFYLDSSSEQSQDEKQALQGFIKQTQEFLQRDDSFQIAFAGTIKAGKSTLINAMLKEDYASTSVTPETAALTKFRYGEKSEIKVTFYNDLEWNELYKSIIKNSNSVFMQEYEKNNAEAVKNQYINAKPIRESLNAQNLKKYTSSQAQAHYFVKEVEISFPNFPYKQDNIVFVDTPGLDDAVDYRSRITRDYINRANAVVVCVQSSALTNSELSTIIRIFDHTGGHPEKVYIVGTKYENLNKPHQDWEKQKAEWSKYLSSERENEKTTFTPELANKNIIPTSGYIALLCELYKQKRLDEDQEHELKGFCYKLFRDLELQNHVDELERFANVGAIHTRIKQDILINAQQQIIEDTKNEYKNLHQSIVTQLNNQTQALYMTYESSKEGIDKINERLQEQEQRLEGLKQTQQELQETMQSFEVEAQEMLEKLDTEIQQIIESI